MLSHGSGIVAVLVVFLGFFVVVFLILPYHLEMHSEIFMDEMM